MSTKMLDFTDVHSYVEAWCAWEEVTLTDVHPSDKAFADPAHSNHLVRSGIGFRLWTQSGRHKISFKELYQNCCADSHQQGLPASTNQIKNALGRWITNKAVHLEDTTVGDDMWEWKPNFVIRDH